jgi:DNA-directed RNA polymerase subunit M/transcription elongation factor TFIIS
MKFCVQCNNLLAYVFGETLSFKCKICNIPYPAEPEDTLLFSNDERAAEQNKILVYSRTAVNDDTLTRVYMDCPKCGEKVANQLLIGTEEYVMYLCTNASCRTTFVRGMKKIE